MNKILLLSTLAVSAMSIGSAKAQDNFWYVGVNGGLVFPDEQLFKSAPTVVGVLDGKKDFSVNGQVGYNFGRFRLETDVGYQENRFKSIANFGLEPLALNGSYASPLGKQATWSFMLNGLVDVVKYKGITMSVGGGAGAVRVNVRNLQLNSASPVSINDHNWAFAYQALAEAGLPITQNIDLTIGYRFLRSDKINLESAFASPISTRLENHTAFAGFRFKLQSEKPTVREPVAPPVPPAAVAPPTAAPVEAITPPPAPPPGPLIVFFDFNKSTVTTEAKHILSQAAMNYRNSGQAALEIDGYADRAGTDDYNQKLSQRRAESVRQELIELGVPKTALSINAFGETRPKVETADGVREPQNRRVEILIK